MNPFLVIQYFRYRAHSFGSMGEMFVYRPRFLWHFWCHCTLHTKSAAFISQNNPFYRSGTSYPMIVLLTWTTFRKFYMTPSYSNPKFYYVWNRFKLPQRFHPMSVQLHALVMLAVVTLKLLPINPDSLFGEHGLKTYYSKLGELNIRSKKSHVGFLSFWYARESNQLIKNYIAPEERGEISWQFVYNFQDLNDLY